MCESYVYIYIFIYIYMYVQLCIIYLYIYIYHFLPNICILYWWYIQLAWLLMQWQTWPYFPMVGWELSWITLVSCARSELTNITMQVYQIEPSRSSIIQWFTCQCWMPAFNMFFLLGPGFGASNSTLLSLSFGQVEIMCCCIYKRTS